MGVTDSKEQELRTFIERADASCTYKTDGKSCFEHYVASGMMAMCMQCKDVKIDYVNWAHEYKDELFAQKIQWMYANITYVEEPHAG